MRKLPVLSKLHTHTHTHTVLYSSLLERETEHLWIRQPMHEIGRVQGERERERACIQEGVAKWCP